MTNINPFSGAIAQSTQVQQRASAENQRQLRRMQNLDRNSGLQGDRLEHQVESSDASPNAGDDDGAGQGGAGHGDHGEPEEQPKSEESPGDGRPHIDIRA
jgi:hypothetical protein